MFEEMLGKKILVVTAHPDDESALAGGTIWKLSLAGGEIHLLCATKGEKGTSHIGRPCEPDELKNIRAEELENARICTGISHLRIYDFPDGQLLEYVENFEKMIQDHVDFFRPDYMLGFGEDGYTGHSDHVASFKAGFASSFKAGVPYVSFALPGGEIGKQYKEKLLVKRLNGAYQDDAVHLDPDFVVNVDKNKKLEAMRCHLSQWEGLDPEKVFGKELAEHFLTHEYFSTL